MLLKVYMKSKLYIVLTFGVASCLCRNVCETLKEARKTASKIKRDNGIPYIYDCRLIK